MKTALWTFAGVVAGLALAFVLVVAVEGFSDVVHPFPEGSGKTMDEVCEHVARYPAWVLAVVVPAWAITTLLAVWTAQKIGNLFSATFVGLFLLAMVAFNLSMLPYPIWFNVANLIAVPAAILLGMRWGRTKKEYSGTEQQEQLGQGAEGDQTPNEPQTVRSRRLGSREE